MTHNSHLNFLPSTELNWSTFFRREMADCCRVSYSSVKGRHLVASRDVVAGSLILAERASLWLLNPDVPEEVVSRCQHCFRSCRDTFVACPDCVDVVFCSLGCKDRATTAGYHAYDCQSRLFRYRRMDSADSFRVFLTLRTIYSVPLEVHKERISTKSNGRGG